MGLGLNILNAIAALTAVQKTQTIPMWTAIGNEIENYGALAYVTWTTSILYKVGVVIKRNNSLFLCLTEHTSGTFYTDWLTNSYWTPVSDYPGKMIIHPRATTIPGYLLCDNSTIGKTGSGATYTGDMYRELYEFLGNSFGGTKNWDAGNTINLPDTRGIFLRGAGTSAKLSNANSVAFSGTFAAYQNDKSQGYNMYVKEGVYYAYSFTSNASAGGGSVIPTYRTSPVGTTVAAGPFTNGTDGTPRTGGETNPANLSINYIIKY